MATRAQARYEITAVDRTKRAFSRVTKSLGVMKDQAKAATKSIAAVGAAGALAVGALALKSLKAAAGLKQLSTQTGQAVGPLQRVQKILNAIGKGDDAADTILDLTEALGEARTEPGGEKGKALARLGIDPNKVTDILDLVRQLSAAYDKAKDKSKFLFNVKDLSDSAGAVAAAIGGSFDELLAATKGTILDTDTIDAAAKSMMQFRVIMGEVTSLLSAGILNSAAMKTFQASLDQVFKVLGKEGIVGALAEIVNILMEKFPKATEFVFDQFAQMKKDIEDIIRVKNQVGTAIGTGAGVASEFIRQGPAKDAGVIAEILRQIWQATVGTEKNTRQPATATAG